MMLHPRSKAAWPSKWHWFVSMLNALGGKVLMPIQNKTAILAEPDASACPSPGICNICPHGHRIGQNSPARRRAKLLCENGIVSMKYFRLRC